MKKWSESDDVLLGRLFESNLSTKDVAQEMSCTISAVHNRCRKLGLVIKKRPGDLEGLELSQWLWVNRILPFLTINSNGCMEWNKSSDSHGYGDIRTKKKLHRTHRISFEANNRIVLTSQELVLHKCDNPKCNNPDHLYIGTQLDNVRDMMTRGRSAGQFLKGHNIGIENILRGENCKASKLTDDIVLEARRLNDNNIMGYRRLARQYGVSDSTMRAVLKRKTWTHI